MRASPVSSAVEVRTRPPHYPVNLELRGEPVLVVGGGRVASRKVAGLVEAGAIVTVVAPEAIAELRDNIALRWHQRAYQRGEAASYRVVITATGVAEVDAQVARDAKATGVPVNSADDPDNCSFTLPALIRLGDLQIAVSSTGRSPAFASWMRDRIESTLQQSMSVALEIMAEVRDQVRALGASSETPAWRRALDSGFTELVASGRTEEARTMLWAQLALDGISPQAGQP